MEGSAFTDHAPLEVTAGGAGDDANAVQRRRLANAGGRDVEATQVTTLLRGVKGDPATGREDFVDNGRLNVEQLKGFANPAVVDYHEVG